MHGPARPPIPRPGMVLAQPVMTLSRPVMRLSQPTTAQAGRGTCFLCPLSAESGRLDAYPMNSAVAGLKLAQPVRLAAGQIIARPVRLESAPSDRSTARQNGARWPATNWAGEGGEGVGVVIRKWAWRAV